MEIPGYFGDMSDAIKDEVAVWNSMWYMIWQDGVKFHWMTWTLIKPRSGGSLFRIPMARINPMFASNDHNWFY
jgi:hypothetical protein